MRNVLSLLWPPVDYFSWMLLALVMALVGILATALYLFRGGQRGAALLLLTLVSAGCNVAQAGAVGGWSLVVGIALLMVLAAHRRPARCAPARAPQRCAPARQRCLRQEDSICAEVPPNLQPCEGCERYTARRRGAAYQCTVCARAVPEAELFVPTVAQRVGRLARTGAHRPAQRRAAGGAR